VLRRDWLAHVGPEKGLFRTFLLACLKNYLLNERARELGPTRNPGQPILSIDAQEAETRYGLEPPDEEDPARLYERRWAFTLIGQVLQQLKSQCVADGSAGLFDALSPYLTGDAARGDYSAIAARLNMTEGAVRTAVARLRAKFRDLLRAEIACTVDSPAEVDGEIAHLFKLFER
jgi:RNA polymerase sigma-70 factor (ECF subfamily)